MMADIYLTNLALSFMPLLVFMFANLSQMLKDIALNQK